MSESFVDAGVDEQEARIGRRRSGRYFFISRREIV
jgi:hypothetical protein